MFRNTLIIFVIQCVVSSTIVSAEPPPLYNQVRVLSIGISDFHNSRLNLDSPAQSAERIANMFRSHFGYDVLPPLTNQAATKAGIDQYLAEHTADLGANDALIIFISTHGVSVTGTDGRRQGFLVPQDVTLNLDQVDDYEAWERQALGMRSLGDQLNQLKARHVVVLVEACCSGYLGLMGASPTKGQVILASNHSRCAITAGTATQTAKEGIFAGELLATLSQLDRAMTARELHILIRDGVMNQLRANEMTPQYRELLPERRDAGGSAPIGEFVFVPHGIQPEQIENQVKQSRSIVIKDMGQAVTVHDVFDAFEAPNYRYSADPIGGERKWKAQLARFTTSAATGNPFALAGLYICYSKGLGADPAPEIAYRWAQEAFDSGHPIGTYAMGLCYRHGVGVTRNAVAGDRLLSLGAEQENAMNCFVLGNDLVQQLQAGQQLTEVQATRMRSLLEIAADAGLPSARLLMGELYANGAGGTEQDLKLAFQLITKAAETGNIQSLAQLHSAYRSGISEVVAQNIQLAMAYLRQAAAAGDASAQAALGVFLAEGAQGFPKDIVEARKWLELASAQGDDVAMIKMVELLTAGNLGTKNLVEAVAILEQAAAAGNYIALFTKGRWLEEGIYYKADPAAAIPLYERAARGGVADAWFYAGSHFESEFQKIEVPTLIMGDTISLRSYVDAWERRRPLAVKAVSYFIRASKLGNKDAKNALSWYEDQNNDLPSWLLKDAHTRVIEEDKNLSVTTQPLIHGD